MWCSISCAAIEAAHCAVRYDPSVRRFYQRKCAKGLSVVAIKAVAHELARACYHILREGVPYDGDSCARPDPADRHGA